MSSGKRAQHRSHDASGGGGEVADAGSGSGDVVHNRVDGGIFVGPVVQVGAVYGDVHVHPPATPPRADRSLPPAEPRDRADQARAQVIPRIYSRDVLPTDQALAAVPQAEIPVRLVPEQAGAAGEIQAPAPLREPVGWIGDEKLPLNLFDDSGGSLLVLGERGSGKSVFLKRLVKGLLMRAAQQDDQPLPIYLDLATWQAGTNLHRWMAAYVERAGIGPAKFLRWLRDGAVVLVFDNLDRPLGGTTAQTIHQINELLHRYPELPGIAAASAMEPYEAARARLHFRSAVVLDQLSPHTVQSVLDIVDSPRLSRTIAEHAWLRELLQNRLALTLIWQIGAIDEVDLGDVTTPGLDTRSKIIALYVKKLRSRAEAREKDSPRRFSPPWDEEKIDQWMHHLAHYMTRFGIRNLHPLWLQPEFVDDTPGWRARFARFVVVSGSAVASLVILLSVVAPAGLILADVPTGTAWDHNALPNDLMLDLLLGITILVGVGLGYDRNISPIVKIGWQWPLTGRQLAITALATLLTGMAVGVVTWLTGHRGEALPVGACFALGIIGTYIAYKGAAVERNAAGAAPSVEWDPWALMLRGVRFAIIIGVAGGTVAGIAIGVAAGPAAGVIEVVKIDLISAIVLATVNAIRAGGRAWIQHAIVCLVIAASGRGPLRYQHFLKTLERRQIMLPGHRSYYFQHETIAEFFATQDPNE